MTPLQNSARAAGSAQSTMISVSRTAIAVLLKVKDSGDSALPRGLPERTSRLAHRLEDGGQVVRRGQRVDDREPRADLPAMLARGDERHLIGEQLGRPRGIVRC